MIRPVNAIHALPSSVRFRQLITTLPPSAPHRTPTSTTNYTINKRVLPLSDRHEHGNRKSQSLVVNVASSKEEPNVIPWLTREHSTSSAEDLLTKAKGITRVVLKRGNAFFVLRGNNLIFANAIKKTTGPKAKLGDQVIVYDTEEKIIGWGVFNPYSVYRVRMLQTIEESQSDMDSVLDIVKVFQSRLKTALQLRSSLQLPSPSTNAFRIVNSDGDQLSGVVVDRFCDVVVVHSGTAWLELNRRQIVEVLKTTLEVDTVIWRLRPVVREEEGIPDAKEAIYSERADFGMHSEIEIVENGVKFAMAVKGQKTGFYTDQRDNRLFLRSIARDRRVLDLCCYTGGFALNAAVGGATEIVAIDSSRDAINLANRNAERNGVASVCRFECGDILDRLQVFATNCSSWDIVVLDPPKLAFSQSTLTKSLGRYRKLNRSAMKVVTRGGILITCSCSGLVDIDLFINAIWEAAGQIGRRLTILRVSGAGADHVYDLNHPEGNYLKCIVARVM